MLLYKRDPLFGVLENKFPISFIHKLVTGYGDRIIHYADIVTMRKAAGLAPDFPGQPYNPYEKTDELICHLKERFNGISDMSVQKAEQAFGASIRFVSEEENLVLQVA